MLVHVCETAYRLVHVSACMPVRVCACVLWGCTMIMHVYVTERVGVYVCMLVHTNVVWVSKSCIYMYERLCGD